MLLLLALVGCREPTQITVQLFSDLPCDTLQSRGVSLSASSPDRAESNPPLVVARECKEDGAGSSVGTLVLVPSGEPDALVGIRAVAGVGKQAEACEAPGYEGCIVARREVRFQEHASLVVRIDLRAECEGNPCDPRSTCVAGKECRGINLPKGQCEGSGCGEEILPPGKEGAGGTGGVGGSGQGGVEGGSSGTSGQGSAGAGKGGQGGQGGADQGGEGGTGQAGGGEAGADQGGKAGSGAGGESGGQGGTEQAGAGQGGAGAGGGEQGGTGGCSEDLSKLCEKAGANCGTLTGQCGGTIACQHYKCTSPGLCDSDGCPEGLMCNQATNRCLCPSNQLYCYSPPGVSQVFLAKCSAEGTSFFTKMMCADSEDCSGGISTGVCQNPLFPYCVGASLNKSGQQPKDCTNECISLSGGLCVKCQPGSLRCEGATLMECGPGGLMEDPVDLPCASPEDCEKGIFLGHCPVL